MLGITIFFLSLSVLSGSNVSYASNEITTFLAQSLYIFKWTWIVCLITARSSAQFQIVAID
jgi:hypothetical protein